MHKLKLQSCKRLSSASISSLVRSSNWSIPNPSCAERIPNSKVSADQTLKGSSMPCHLPEKDLERKNCEIAVQECAPNRTTSLIWVDCFSKPNHTILIWVDCVPNQTTLLIWVNCVPNQTTLLIWVDCVPNQTTLYSYEWIVFPNPTTPYSYEWFVSQSKPHYSYEWIVSQTKPLLIWVDHTLQGQNNIKNQTPGKASPRPCNQTHMSELRPKPNHTILIWADCFSKPNHITHMSGLCPKLNHTTHMSGSHPTRSKMISKINDRENPPLDRVNPPLDRANPPPAFL